MTLTTIKTNLLAKLNERTLFGDDNYWLDQHLLAKTVCNKRCGHAQILKELLGNILFYTDVKNGSGYIYSEETRLWIACCEEQLYSFFTNILEEVIHEQVLFINSKYCDYYYDKVQLKQKLLDETLDSVRTFAHIKIVCKFLRPLIYDPMVKKRLNTFPVVDEQKLRQTIILDI